MSERYDPSEMDELLGLFREMLSQVTRDGAIKRIRNEKPSWKVDPSHEAAIFSHLSKWKKGELVDPDSGAHPLVHAAWRCLAVAWQEVQRESLEERSHRERWSTDVAQLSADFKRVSADSDSYWDLGLMGERPY